MKLIPEQVSFIRKKIRSLKGEIRVLETNAKSNEDIHKKHLELEEYDKLLKVSEYVKEIPIEQIGIGTKFSIKFEGETETEDYVLIDQRLAGNHLVQELITAESSIGKNVIGKKEGESFPGGIIDKIYKDRRNCLSYLSELNTNYDDNDFEITESQKQLLKIEEDRVSRQINLKGARAGREIDRLTQIKEILNSTNVAMPSGDTIEVGTSFEISLFMDNGTITKNVELINRAVSDELENEYVEKNSAIGQAILGLKENDEFTVILEEKPVLGVVTNLSREFIKIKESKNVYQKTRGV